MQVIETADQSPQVLFVPMTCKDVLKVDSGLVFERAQGTAGAGRKSQNLLAVETE